MTLGLAPKQGDLLRTTVGYCEGRVGVDSIYAVLNRECSRCFPKRCSRTCSPMWGAGPCAR